MTNEKLISRLSDLSKQMLDEGNAYDSEDVGFAVTLLTEASEPTGDDALRKPHESDCCFYPTESGGMIFPCKFPREFHRIMDVHKEKYEEEGLYHPFREATMTRGDSETVEATEQCHVAARKCSAYNDGECLSHYDVIGDITFESQYQYGKFVAAEASDDSETVEGAPNDKQS